MYVLYVLPLKGLPKSNLAFCQDSIYAVGVARLSTKNKVWLHLRALKKKAICFY